MASTESSASSTPTVSTLRWRAVQGKDAPDTLAFGTADEEEEIRKKLDRSHAIDDENCSLLLPEAPQLTLEWRDLALRVPVANEPGAMEKLILHDANGIARPGELVAIMGPSGAGKSSLLDCLSGRNVNVEGCIMVNGVAGWMPKLRKLVAYAMQDELFHATLTVREHLVFQARLRLGGQFMNPADHFMEQLVVLERATDHEGLARVQRLKDAWAEQQQKRQTQQSSSHSVRKAKASTWTIKQTPPVPDTVDVVVYEVEGRDEDGLEDPEYVCENTRLPLWGQIEVLAHRNALRLARDPMAFRLQALQTLIFAFLLGLIYFQLQVDQKGIRNFSGAFFYIVTDQVYSASMPAIISVPVELPIVYRELDVGLYRIGAWFLAKNLCELPSQLALPTLNLVPIYLLIFGFFGSPGVLVFLQMLALLVAMNSSCVAFGYAISCICRRVDIAPIVGNMVIMPLLLLGGMFVDPERVPAMFRWLELVTPFKYGYFGFMRAFWRNVADIPCDLQDAVADCTPMTGLDVLRGFNVPDQSVWSDVWSLIALSLLFRALGFVALHFSVRHK
ncbi:hypothetical protein PF005_g20687 [Phytophthora fragariae]|uniref:ABC transporter domain-containing protein n=1 Tax=Phytophthora fragariae TaxID=53985 RepID=A0A6A3WPB1_9STRA|nr:hypothetical protein PF005_g20687 [Phytophthora fragariae]